MAGLEDAATSVEGLRLSSDNRTGYFSAAGRPDTQGSSDLYVATRDTPAAPFGNIVPFEGRINTRYRESDPSVGEVRAELFNLVFAREDPSPGNPSQLVYATAPAGYPFEVVGPVFDGGATDDRTPFLRKDGNVLYFASKRVPAKKDDIYYAIWTGATFDAPTSVGDYVNTADVELAPVVTPDDLTMYYGSDRSDRNLGQRDIWIATRGSTSELFAHLANVSEINSDRDDLPTFVTADRCTLYFSSTRSGSLSIYVATKSPPAP